MKKLLMVAMALIVATSGIFAADKYDKQAAKEAKQRAKDGWMVAPGAQPLEMQLAKSYRMHDEMTDDGEPKWIIGSAMTVGENYDGAKLQAMSLAINNIAQQLQTAVASEINNNVANSQLGADEAATVTKTVMGGTQWIANTIGKVITVVECYQILPNKNRNVLIEVAYSEKKARESVKQALRKELEKEGEDILKAADKIF